MQKKNENPLNAGWWTLTVLVLLLSFARFAGMLVIVRFGRMRYRAQRLHATFAGDLFRFHLQ